MHESLLGERIRACRQRLGWSQNELASRAGVKQPTLQRIEAAKRQDPGFSIVDRLARALGVSLDLLAGRDGETATSSERVVSAIDASIAQHLHTLEERLRRLEISVRCDA